jgi:ABC-2 type transport system ATP-binding protein
MVEPAIHVNGLTKVFKSKWKQAETHVVRGVSLSVFKGEIFGLLGENGAGKTTTLELILGLLAPTAGEVRVFGGCPRDLDVRRRISYLPETPRYQGYLSATEFLQFHMRLHGLNPEKKQDMIARTLLDLNLARENRKKLARYSRGMLQRIGLAQALFSSPELLFLDEPTSGLDPSGVKFVRDTILATRARGATVFLNSHNLSEVEKVCDRVAFMKHGRVTRIVDLRPKPGCPLRVEIVLSHRVDRLSDVLRNWEILSAGGTEERTMIMVGVQREDQISSVIDAIRAVGGGIISVTPGEVSLEQLFLRYVSSE